ncbi:hypothetical protein [Sorangium sp. So ce1151]|uniref:hypothetical protein n=1 Tax=Sorangium sp. So ce1151 TaxID=3133332 RepID=UPI003F60FCA3
MTYQIVASVYYGRLVVRVVCCCMSVVVLWVFDVRDIVEAELINILTEIRGGTIGQWPQDGRLVPGDDFVKRLSLSSMEVIRFVMTVEEKFQIELFKGEEDLAALNSFGELIGLIERETQAARIEAR